jgi:hypothetical protein
MQVVFVWPRPRDVPRGAMPCLSWGFARIHGPASMQGKRDVLPSGGDSMGSRPGLGVGVGFAAPVLARGWGSRLQLLQVHPPGGYGPEFTTVRFVAVAAPGADAAAADVLAASGKKADAARPLDFVVADDLECGAAVAAIGWLGEQVRRAPQCSAVFCLSVV